MAGGADHNYGEKGKTFGKIMIAIALFVILLIWVYGKNQLGVPA